MRTLPTSYLFRLCCHQSQVSWLAALLSQCLACFFELAFTLLRPSLQFALFSCSTLAQLPPFRELLLNY